MTSYPCPVCLTEANLETGCPGCGRAPDPLAAEVIELDVRIAELRPKVAAARDEIEQAKAAYALLSEQLQAAQRRRGQLAAQVWAGAHAQAVPIPAAPTQAAPTQAPIQAAPAPARPETSTQTVKNVLFVLGGILLSVAAIVFTAFAWGTFGMAGKAIILAIFTAATLSVPVLALRQNLRGTAETFASLGLLLVVLDGYSIWRVDLGGVQEAISGWTYSGLVAAVTAAVAIAYGRLTRLTAPGIIGLVVAQPVLPLVFEPLGSGRPTGLALVFAMVAAVNLPVVRRRFSVLQMIATISYAIALSLAHVYAFLALAEAHGTGALAVAGAVTLLAGAIALAGPLVRPEPAWLTAAVAWCIGLTVLVGMVFALRLVPGHALLWTVGLITALAIGTVFVRRGPAWLGALIGVGGTGGIAALIVGSYAAANAVAALGVFEDARNVSFEVLLLTVAAVALAWRTRFVEIAAVIGAVVLAFSSPKAPAVADLVVTAALLAVLLWRRPSDEVRVVIAMGVAVLPVHAVLTGLDRPAQSAYTLGGILLLAVATAVVGRWRDRIAGLVAVAVAAPVFVALGVAVAGTVHMSQLHAMVLTAALLPISALALRGVPGYARAADVSTRVTVLVAVLIAVVAPGDGWTKSLYVAGAALALAVLDRGPVVERIVGWSVLGLALLLARPPLAAFVEFYSWIGRGWGEVPELATTVALGDVIAFAVLLVPLWRWRWALAAFAALPVVLALVHFGLVWPWAPFVLLLTGLLLLAVPRVPLFLAPYAVVLAGSGLSGLSVQSWSTITGLALVCVAAAIVGLFSRWGVAGWSVFAVAWIGLAVCSAHAAHLPARGVALTVLVAAAVLLFIRLLPNARVVEIPAHLTALVILATSPSAARLSEAALIWGIALGLSVFPRLASDWLLRLSAAGVLEIIALWALLISRNVGVVEAYSLPLAGVALIVGFLALRHNPALTSWVGYGPALVAALGPSLAVTLPVSGDPVRRLMLGVAALLIVIAGAVRRRQAPVVIGGAVLVILALHELTQVWSRLPLWLPIGVGGAILVGLAVSYERRLRDLRTLRSRISSFT